MANLLVDENFQDHVVDELRRLGHDLATVRAEGLAGRPDAEILDHATKLGRIVLTYDRDFRRLHATGAPHAGIVHCSFDRDGIALARRIDAALIATPAPSGVLMVVVKPPSPRGA